MYVFNKITVTPQLPERIRGLSVIAKNMWWSWNTEFLRLFKYIDGDLWERAQKNPVKFLSMVSQEKLDAVIENDEFLRAYDEIYGNFKSYMESKNTWFKNKYPRNQDDIIAYFSAEYGLDEILPIYSGGLGILSGDHMKSSSDLGIPLVGVGLFYKMGYFHQEIDGNGNQNNLYKKLDVDTLPISTVKDEDGNDMIIDVDLPIGKMYLKVWCVNVGRCKIYLMDSDIDKNSNDEIRSTTLCLYGGDQENRIRQEIVLGVAGTRLLKQLRIVPTIYHMNEGHSSFLILELIRAIMEEKQVSFDLARDIVSSKTIFTTHTPVPAGNDIFPTDRIEEYFSGWWEKYGISKEEFLKLGMEPKAKVEENGFNMGILALKVAGKKNGVSKLHREVSSELFSEVWPNISSKESPITYVTNGIHTCSWLSPGLKRLYNKYFTPYWQDMIYDDSVWEDVENIPDDELWEEHMKRKKKLLDIVKENTINRLRRSGYSYEQIMKVTNGLNPNALIIGFARRFATYKRATLIFKDIERITQILNDKEHPVQLIFAGKAHPADQYGQDLIRYIHELSLKPQFVGKIFILEDYNIGMSRYLISGVDVWLNNPRRPLEASGTSGQKASVNGVINFSVLDGWWAEGYNTKNGWKIGTETNHENYDVQDNEDAVDLYNTLEKKIVPTYYNKSENGISNEWLKIMKESIISTGGKYSTARMLVDYTEKLYMPLCNLNKSYYRDLTDVAEFDEWKKKVANCWSRIKISQEDIDNMNDAVIDAGNTISVSCKVKLPNISKENVAMQVYCGQIMDNGQLDNINVTDMRLIAEYEDDHEYVYQADIQLKTGGNYGYTFRAMPKHEMLLDAENLSLVNWFEEK
ncbi:MAG: alpha-glucan family phosphorylase [Clostridia bacterium]|nr:alpha-glucan family phosphorylase [Clostridia bacterium]